MRSPKTIPAAPVATPALAALLLLAAGCATLQQVAALRRVTFAFDRISDVRIAGVAVGPGTSFSSLGLADAARLTAAVVAKEVPLECVAHLGATNPSDNRATAKLVGLDWTMFVEDRESLAGGLASAVAIAPGATSDVPLSVRVDLVSLGTGGARDLFELGRAFAGYGSSSKELRFELRPTIETSLGPIRYPAPIVVRRTAP